MLPFFQIPVESQRPYAFKPSWVPGMTGDCSVGTEGLDRRLRDGDAQALAELFSHERERLWRIIQFRLAEPLRGRLGPEDVLQEAFLAASQRLKHYADSSATSPFIWLRMILNQTLVDLHRQHLGTQRRDASAGRPDKRGMQPHRNTLHFIAHSIPADYPKLELDDLHVAYAWAAR